MPSHSLSLIEAGVDPYAVHVSRVLNPAQRQVAPTLALFVSGVGTARAETLRFFGESFAARGLSPGVVRLRNRASLYCDSIHYI